MSGVVRLMRGGGGPPPMLEELLVDAANGHASLATAAGDRRKLRGIPAVAPGVAGATAGSVPHRDAPSLRA